jgi:hypothetical protein
MSKRIESWARNAIHRVIIEIGYTYGAMLGVPVPSPRRPHATHRRWNSPPPGHPEVLSSQPPSPVERLLWDQIRTATRFPGRSS